MLPIPKQQMITFKKLQDSDEQFNHAVYRSTREKELSLSNWPEHQKHMFCIMQSIAQMADYKRKFENAIYQVVYYKNKPAGRFFSVELDAEIRVIEISMLPAFQGKGIGTKIISDTIKLARQKNKKTSLHVAHGNPARNLYERLGFVEVSNTSTHTYMECNNIKA